MPGLMSGDWKRGTVSGPQRLQPVRGQRRIYRLPRQPSTLTLLEEAPFGVIGPELLYLQDLPGAILHQVAFHRGGIVSPTCDFRRPTIEQLRNDPSQPHYTLQPHVVVAQVLPIEVIAERWGANRANNMRLMLEFDAPRRYMYLPSLPGDDRGQQWVVDFTRTDTIAIALLVDQRTYQLTHAAAQHLQYKLVLAGTSVY